MEKCRRIFKKIFFLKPLPTVLVAILGYGLIILVFALEINIPAMQYLSYLCSAYALIVTITGLPHFITFAKRVKQRFCESRFMQKVQRTKLGRRFFRDVRFRTEISLYQGLVINLLYIGMKLFSGIHYRSYWFIALAVYYLLLVIMRVLLLFRRANTVKGELYRYRLCGIVLLVMNQALMGIVIYMVRDNRGFDYPGLLIYLMALYAFYSVITAVINVFKYQRHGSPILSAAKVINLVAAMVSILSLETAMLAQFGGGDETFRALMTGATGGGVCIIVIGMAIYMIWKSTRQLKKGTTA